MNNPFNYLKNALKKVEESLNEDNKELNIQCFLFSFYYFPKNLEQRNKQLINFEYAVISFLKVTQYAQVKNELKI
jgi:hypothetical protein